MEGINTFVHQRQEYISHHRGVTWLVHPCNSVHLCFVHSSSLLHGIMSSVIASYTMYVHPLSHAVAIVHVFEIEC